MAGNSFQSNLTFLGRDSTLARRIGRPMTRFLAIESAGGIILLIATAAALIWANSPWSESYYDFWHTHVDIYIGETEIFAHSLDLFVNDALMALFFLVVGLEIKRELVTGRLRDRRAAALPAIAALGGMIVPALFYVAFNAGTPAAHGWGIPMATDIAFALGIVSLLGARVPRDLKVFLLTLAIVDDIGAIIVIALFYTEKLSVPFLILAVATTGFLGVLIKLRVWYTPIYVATGCFLWWATYRSGVHATIAGVVMGLLTPARPLQSEEEARRVAEWLRDKREVLLVDVRYAAFNIQESVSMAQRLETALHPITSFIIIPIFALANAGVKLSGEIIGDAATSRVTLGIIVGLVLGKTIGVSLFSWLAVKVGVADMPKAMTSTHLVGLAMVSGIGFTVALFITGLAFDAEHAEMIDQAKIGILVASFVASIGGLLLLSRAKVPAGVRKAAD